MPRTLQIEGEIKWLRRMRIRIAFAWSRGFGPGDGSEVLFVREMPKEEGWRLSRVQKQWWLQEHSTRQKICLVKNVPIP